MGAFSRTSGNDDIRAALREALRNRIADAACAARDKHDLIVDRENVFHWVTPNKCQGTPLAAFGLVCAAARNETSNILPGRRVPTCGRRLLLVCQGLL